MKKIESGQGLVGRLLIDEKYGRETSESLAGAFRSVQSAAGPHRRGRPDGIRRDPGAALGPRGQEEGLRAGGQPRRRPPRTWRASTENLEKGTGALPILLNDPRFGKEFTENLRSFSRRLDSIARKLDDGDGTAGKLINDPALFDAANRLVVGVDQSAMLRWLVKDRQKSGIKKEYNDYVKTQAPAPREPTPTPTPTPSSRVRTILVTGGAGFIGSHLADRLLARGDRVVVLDDFNDFYDPRQKRANVAPHLGHPRYRLVEGDIRDRALVFRLFEEERFDAVLHLAARAGVRPSLSQPVLYEEVNCVGDAGTCWRPPSPTASRGSSSLPRRRSTGSTRSSRSPRTTRSTGRSLPTRRRSAPASSRSSTRTTSTACPPCACASSRSTARASAPRWRSPASFAASRRALRSPSTATAARAATTRTSTTSSTASWPRWTATCPSRS